MISDRNRPGHRDHHRGTLRLAVSRDLLPRVFSKRVRPAIRRRHGNGCSCSPSPASRRGVAGRGAGAAVRAAGRRRFSRPRPDPVRDVRRHLHHPGRTWTWPAAGGALARRRASRPRRTCQGARGRNRGAARGAGRSAQIARRHHRRPRIVRRGGQAAAGAARDPLQPVAGFARSRRGRRLGDGHRSDAGTDIVERKFIHALLRDGRITDETRRRIERDLDLEEASLANREYRTGPL